LKKIVASALCLLVILSLASCSGGGSGNSSSSGPALPFYGEGVELVQLDGPAPGDDIAIIKTSMGEIKLRFFPEKAPKAVENFITHAKQGYYNGLSFHKAMEGRAVYTGDPEGMGFGGESIWGDYFEDEFSFDLWHFNGAVSMTNSGPNTNGSQFFIVQADEVPDDMLDKMQEEEFPREVIDRYAQVGGTPWLDHVNTIFAQVYEGMEIIDKIASVEVDENYMPEEDIIIESITIAKA